MSEKERLAKRREWYAKNKESVKASQKKWNDKNKKKLAEIQKNWCQKNPEKYKALKKKSYKKLMSTEAGRLKKKEYNKRAYDKLIAEGYFVNYYYATKKE